MPTLNYRPLQFPHGFVWGAATAAPQIEGAAFEAGKGESTWDRFCRVPGKVRNGDTLDVACDHYHRYKADVRLLASLGLKHYRLSVAWPRIIPDGRGRVNERGLDFYRRLLDTLHEYDIEPWVTLFHWDLPQALEQEGGWRNRQTCDAFARYADVVVRALSSRVKNWISLNEIRAFTLCAYGGGDKAPGIKVPARILNQTFHHALLCHGHAVRAVREHGGRKARVGLTDVPFASIPVTETKEDIAAAEAWFTERSAHILEPIYTGRYSAAYLGRTGPNRPMVAPGDMKLISQPTDFLGLNVYNGAFVRAGTGRQHYEELPMPKDFPRTTCSWLQITPQALYWVPYFAAKCYGVKEIYITENGCGYDADAVVAGEVNDLHRREFVRAYLQELRRAIGDGVPISGYFIWSLMDNFEWQDGYAQRFGIVHNDFRTQKRTPKLSAKWYAKVVSENRIV
jgi:beta-glucosidase